MEILKIAFAGIIGATAMILWMQVMYRYHLSHADIIRALGSWVNPTYRGSLWAGLTIHFLMGVIFSALYTIIIGISPIKSPGAIVHAAMAIGAFHGMVMGMVMNVSVNEHHPLVKYRRNGIGVVIAHLTGHLVYGFFIGLSLVVLNFDFESFPAFQTVGEIGGGSGSLIGKHWAYMLLFISLPAVIFVYQLMRWSKFRGR